MEIEKNREKRMRLKKVKILAVAGLLSGLLAGCGNAIPELTEAEASMIATYAADLMLGSGKEDMSRLIDTEKETKRLADLAQKVAQLQKKKDDATDAAAQDGTAGDPQNTDASPTGTGTAGGAESMVDIADFIGLDGFKVNYVGYEIGKSYPSDEGDEGELTFALDASTGKNLLVIKLDVENVSGEPAVLDVLSKNMMFSVNGDNGIATMALTTILLDDFSSISKDEIGAGETKQYVLIAEINEQIAETGNLKLQMKKGDERANAALQ